MKQEDYFLQVGILFVLVGLNAFFASAEVALISLKQSSIKQLSGKGGRGRCLARLVRDSGKFLATVQVGVTLAGFLASALAADSFSDPLTDYVESLGITFLSHWNIDLIAVVLITVLLSYVSLVFGELVPKQIGLRYPEAIALNAALPIQFLATVAAPFVWFLNASVNFCLALFRIGRDGGRDSVTEEEIRALVGLGEEAGSIGHDEKRMIENVFEFNDRTAGMIMTHRKDVFGLDAGTPPERVAVLLRDAGFSRCPVYEGDIDNIVGLLRSRDFITKFMEDPAPPSIRELMKPMPFFPVSIGADVLFRKMRAKRWRFCVLLDEFGGTAGILTVEDLLEDIVGNLPDDAREKEEAVVSAGKDAWRVKALTELSEVAAATGVPFHAEDSDTHTLSGFIFERLRGIPEKGTRVDIPGTEFELSVESIVSRRADVVLIRKKS